MKDYYKEYKKKIRPIRTDLKNKEREDLETILKAKGLKVSQWIREKIKEDLERLNK